MSLKDEIGKLVAENKDKEAIEARKRIEISERSKIRVEELKPFLDELKASVQEGVIDYKIKDRWDRSNTAVIVTVGRIRFVGSCANSDNLTTVGSGTFWWFFPCCSVEGEESWSFNDRSVGHQWFDSTQDMLVRLTHRVAEEVAKR